MSIKRKRILMLAPCLYGSALGTAVCIRALAQELAELGHRLDVITYAAQTPSAISHEGLVSIHAVAKAVVAPRSGPQGSKWRADVLLWRYARRLGQTRSFDALWGHHVEGIALGRALQTVIRRPLIGHIHTRLGLELPTYFAGRLPQSLGAAAGRLIDRALPQLADALVTLNAADAAAMRRGRGAAPVFVRYPKLTSFAPADADEWVEVSTPHPQAPYAIYSGNADAYQNLGLLCAAATSGGWPLIIATHGPSTSFEAYGWPANARVVRVDSFAQMHTWLKGARLGLCPRLQACGYPIKWLNYWRAGLRLVATAAVGRAVFGPALGSDAHGPALWTAAAPQAFDLAVHQGLSQAKIPHCPQPQTGPSLDSILAAAHAHCKTNRF